jgi:hypothetical protein
MLNDDARLTMLQHRLDAEPNLVAVEAVLLRSAFERLDDWLQWLDQHTATTHTGDPSSTAVLQMLDGIRLKIRRELTTVDEALARVEP